MKNKWDEELKGKIGEVLVVVAEFGKKPMKDWRIEEKTVNQVFGFIIEDRKHQTKILNKELKAIENILKKKNEQ